MPRQIIGISLVRNEDCFITQSICNVVEFCDKIIILDNLSTDNTWQKICQLKQKFPHIETQQIKDYRQSHSYISDYAATDTWVFGVDGDEIYDPTGLKQFREELLNGKFDKYWAIYGNVVNCVELDVKRQKVKGYLSPPSRSMTKLFNFAALKSWEGPCERFHGGKKCFRPGFDETQTASLNTKLSWDQSSFRCLHVCFVQRSTKEIKGAMSRLQPGEKPEWLKRLDRIGVGWLCAGVIQKMRSPWKDAKYRRGDIRTIDAAGFFTDSGSVF